MKELTTRLNQLISSFGERKLRFLAEKWDIPPSTLSDISKGKVVPRIDTISKILYVESDISAEWVMRGEGQMLRGQDKVAEPVTVEILREQLREKDRQIERLLGLLEGRK